MIDTAQLILRHCSFLSLCGNWPCVIDIFSFVQFLWIFFLLLVLVHLLKALFQETSIFSTARWMPSHSNFFVVHVEEPRLLPNSSWSHMKMCLKYWIIFQTPHGFPIDPSLSNIGLPSPNGKTLIGWYSSHSACLLYPFSNFCEVVKRDYLGLFFTIINCFAMQWSGGR